MPYQAQVVVVSDLWGEVGAALAQEAAELRHTTAEHIKDTSVANAAEVTGSLKAGHYIVDEQGSTYQQAVAAALAKNPAARILPEVAAEPGVTIIAVCVEHAAPAEYYTGPTNPGAHPYFTPAAEGERPVFDAAVAALGGKVK